MADNFEFIFHPDTSTNVLVSYTLDGETPLIEEREPETSFQGRAKSSTVTDRNAVCLPSNTVSISGRYISPTVWNQPSWESDFANNSDEFSDVDLNEEDQNQDQETAKDIFGEDDDEIARSEGDWLFVSASQSHK